MNGLADRADGRILALVGGSAAAQSGMVGKAEKLPGISLVCRR
jgi:hypothetical protein